jgi:hypothetical protein
MLDANSRRLGGGSRVLAAREALRWWSQVALGSGLTCQSIGKPRAKKLTTREPSGPFAAREEIWNPKTAFRTAIIAVGKAEIAPRTHSGCQAFVPDTFCFAPQNCFLAAKPAYDPKRTSVRRCRWRVDRDSGPVAPALVGSGTRGRFCFSCRRERARAGLTFGHWFAVLKTEV